MEKDGEAEVKMIFKKLYVDGINTTATRKQHCTEITKIYFGPAKKKKNGSREK